MKNFFLLLLFSISITGWSQKYLNQPNIFFDHIFLPGSIRFNPINDFSQDNHGLIWISSDNGMYRYDGYELKSCNDFVEFQTLIDFQPNSIAINKKNEIYFSFEQREGIAKFKNNFQGLQRFNGILRNYDIHELFIIHDKPAFLSKGRGLFIYNEEEDSVTPFDHQYPLYSLHQIGDTIATGSYGRIIIYAGTTVIRLIDVPNVHDNIKSIQQIDGAIIFSTGNDVYRLNLDDESIDLVVSSDDIDNFNINDFHLTKDQQLWVSTDANGVYMKDRSSPIMHFEKNYYQKGSLSHNRAFNIFEGRDGVLWIATGAGINKYDKNKRYFSHIFHDPFDENTLSADLIRGILETSRGKLLVGTDDGTINIIDSARQNIERIGIERIDNNKVVPFCFMELDPENYLVGTSMGLFKFHLPTKAIEFIFYPKSPSSPKVRQMVRYGKDEIIGLSTGTLWKYNLKTDQHILYTNLKGDNDLFFRKNARVIYHDKEKDDLYVGGIGGVAKLDLESGTFIKRTVGDISDKGDTLKHMVMFLERFNDKLFIGTFKGGLYILDLSKDNLQGKLDWYGEVNGLPDNTIYAVLQDTYGNFWISTNNGISRFNLTSSTFYNYDRNNGLQGEEFNRLAYEKTARGEFIFGGIEGLNIFYPREAYENTIEKISPILLSLEVINHYDQQDNGHPSFNLLNVKELSLDWDQNYLTFKFAANNFSEPEKNRFYYKLENYDDRWIFTNERSATYTGLAPGVYHFKVKAVNPDGTSSTTEASTSIVITTVWWRTWWAGLLFVGIIGMVILYSVKINVNKNKAIKNFLEKEIERRTSELQQSKEELARLNAKKDFIFSILSHDLRSPLTTLKGFLGILVDHFDTLNEKEIKSHAINIKNSVAKSLDLLDNTLFWSLSQMGEITYTPTKVNLNNIFDKLQGLYDLTATKKNINMHLQIEREIDLFVDENMAYITLRNLVSNALKFTPSGKHIYIKAKRIGNNAHIVVQDEGKGIKAEDLSKLFDQSQHYMEKGTSNEKGTGLGLILCKKFTDLNKGKILVESQERAGSKFTVILPIYTPEIIEQDITVI